MILEIAGVKIDNEGKGSFGKSHTWRTYPKAHWIYRTRRIALRSVFPDKLQNFSVATDEKEFQEKPPQATTPFKVAERDQPLKEVKKEDETNKKVEAIKKVFEEPDKKKEELVDQIIKKTTAVETLPEEDKAKKKKEDLERMKKIFKEGVRIGFLSRELSDEEILDNYPVKYEEYLRIVKQRAKDHKDVLKEEEKKLFGLV